MGVRTDMLVSVVIPAYNAEKTIDRCLKSIIQQTYTCLDIVVVDDGSTDNTATMISEYAQNDSRIRLLHQTNQGVSVARNHGIELCRGECLAFVDSDDEIPTNYIEMLLHGHEKGYFSCAILKYINQDGGETKISLTDKNAVLSRRDIMKLSSLGLLNTPTCKLFNISIIKEKKIRFPIGWQIAEDLFFNLDYLDAIGTQAIFVSGEISYNYFRHEESLDNKYVKDYWEVHKKVLEKEKKLAADWEIPQEDWKMYYYRYWEYANHALYNTMLGDSKIEIKEKLKINDSILKEPEVRKALIISKARIRKREYIIYRFLGYKFYYRLKGLKG